MAEIKELFQIPSLPGIQRDGTSLDADRWSDGQWVRWQRARARKMGGFVETDSLLSGPVRSTLVWSRESLNTIVTFSSGAVEQVAVDQNGQGSTVYDRTPSGFTDDPDNHIWSVDTMYDDAVGSENTIIIAVATQSLLNIDDPTTKQVYYGVAGANDAFTAISGLSVSGGVVCSAPYLIYYGSDGQVGWSDANQPRTLTTGDAGSDRVTGAKVVKGLPMRGANGPGALLWTLDSLISMQYVGGGAIFRFTTVSSQTSILAQNSVIEYDGSFFWVGIDRFLVFSGGQVQELPNMQNLNWFFDHLNFEHRQKVWAMKVPRYGEIWWFYPRDDATECSHAVIFNVREKCWYDVELSRSSGYYSQVFHYPIMTGPTSRENVLKVQVGTITGTFEINDTVQSSNSDNIFKVTNILGSILTLLLTSAYEELSIGESVVNLSQTGSAPIVKFGQAHSSFIHEKGVDAVKQGMSLAIPAYCETCDFGYPTGGTQPNQPKGLNRWTRLIRVEPDILITGEMTLEVTGQEFANAPVTTSTPFTFDSNTVKIDMREQRRLIRLRFSSNVQGGNFEMGRTILHLEPGDVRS